MAIHAPRRVPVYCNELSIAARGDSWQWTLLSGMTVLSDQPLVGC